MEPIRLLHIADIHIGIENYGRLDTATGLHTRLQDFSNCLKFAVDTALERDVDAVLFAGDAYKTATPTPTHEGIFAEQMKRFADADMPVIMVTGNHDIPAAFGKSTALNIFRTLGGEEHFHVIEKPEIKTISTKRGAFQAACFPWPTRHMLLTKDEYKNLSDQEINRTIEEKCENRIQKFTRDLDPELPAVFVAHLAAADVKYSGTERTTIIGNDPIIAQSLLKSPDFDYVALGHIHRHQDLNRGHQPPVVYPGSIERIDFGEAGEDKGFCLVSLEKGASQYEFIATPARKFMEIKLDVREEEFPADVILKAIKKHDIQDAVVRLSYTITESQKSLIEPRLLYAALEDAFLIAGVAQRLEEIRTQRPRISDDASMTDAFNQYLDQRPELADVKDDLDDYGRRLIQELEMVEGS
ncbi:exonuclease sbcCD subunit D [candidate division KSB3 bacterium]|uniref:Nuclease SbcCD subunit D n=1 Tax=candidate division KSB3 bacterium TaxID=2044937 RepID=A0A2G6KEU5_9BACT|nr:MAG: exonuclease sbcCD subunit D [candidate division KSB3 bacterium]